MLQEDTQWLAQVSSTSLASLSQTIYQALEKDLWAGDLTQYPLYKQRLLYLNSAVVKHNVEQPVDLDRANQLMTFWELYERPHVQVSSDRHIRYITYITFIILPLTMISSYFGMNFESMTKGIFQVPHANWLVLSLFVISIGITSLILLL